MAVFITSVLIIMTWKHGRFFKNPSGIDALQSSPVPCSV